VHVLNYATPPETNLTFNKYNLPSFKMYFLLKLHFGLNLN
jgi:hypothetical protein